MCSPTGKITAILSGLLVMNYCKPLSQAMVGNWLEYIRLKCQFNVTQYRLTAGSTLGARRNLGAAKAGGGQPVS